MKIHHSCLCKNQKKQTLFKNRSGIKAIREKTGFLRFIWKLESRKLFEDWSLEKLNLRIGILDIKFEINQTFGNRKLSSEIGIWKNCLKWNFKINN